VIGRGREEGRIRKSTQLRSGDIYKGKMYGTETTCVRYFAEGRGGEREGIIYVDL